MLNMLLLIRISFLFVLLLTLMTMLLLMTKMLLMMTLMLLLMPFRNDKSMHKYYVACTSGHLYCYLASIIS